MPLTRLDNLITSKTGKYLYVSPDDFNATDALSNRGNSPVTPFKSIQRAFIEIARYSYLPGFDNDRFDQFTIMLMPGIHYIDNRPGLADTSDIDVFGFDQANNAWTDNSILDLSNPDNIYYKFNNTEGGAIIPRGSSLVGYDLRRTTLRPLYVPDPASLLSPRTALFNVTGGCYFWQFTIKDGQTTSESPLYNASAGTGEVYYDPTDFTKKTAPNYSHHKLTVFEYADSEELGLYYRKIAKGFSAYQPTIDDPGEFDQRVQENRIVGPLSDSRVIESLKFTDSTTDPSIPPSTTEIEVTTKVDHGYFQGQFVGISNTEIDDVLEGIFPITKIDQNDTRKFIYEVPVIATAIGTNIVSGQTISVDTTPALGQNAQTLAEVDSVESASPYVFNCSIRSTWGICGIWANGLKATGFKSVVIAQYTGVSLQQDDRSFIRYDEYSNTWNQASLTDAFATVPYHTKGDSYWKDDWRNFHVRASEDAFIQCVSIFAVGYADHFLMESGGDMSITNSNSNFGNTSLHAIGHKGFSFNQDKGGYITDIIPPQQVVDSATNVEKIQYYTVDIQGTIQNPTNYTKLFLGSEDIIDPLTRPAATITGYRLGAKTNEKLNVKLEKGAVGDEFFNVTLEPTGFVKYIAKGSILNPSGYAINNVYADAANLIESNRRMIQEEVFGYILEKYPDLKNISYVNPGLDPAANRYADARDLIQANRQEIVNSAWQKTVDTYPAHSSAEDKCKRDIGYVVDAISEDLRDGGNANIIEATKTYFDGSGNAIANGVVGEEREAVYAFNRARDLSKQAIANLLTVTDETITIDPANAISASYTPTNAVYDPATGDLVLTVVGHGYTVLDTLKISSDSLTFTCAMDNNVSQKKYPRVSDPAYDKKLAINSVTSDTLTVNIGASPIVNYDVSNAVYNEASGEMVLTVGTHNLDSGSSIKLADNSLSFTCTKDGNSVAQSYPRPGTDPAANTAIAITGVGSSNITATNATYTPSTGALQLTVAGHGITAPTTGTVTAATYTPSSGALVLTISNHGFKNGDQIRIADNSLSFTCTKDGGAQQKTYPRSTDPVSNKWIPISNVTTNTFEVNVGSTTLGDFPHTFQSGTAGGVEKANGAVKLDDGSITFSCAKDNNATNHAYPRSSDPASGQWLPVSNVSTNTFEVNIGVSSDVSAHTFVSAVSNGIKKQDGTITINVGAAASVGDQYAHTFVSATAGAVISGGAYAHTFVSAATNSVTIYADRITSSASRNKDARNLIIANKDYILDGAVAEVAVYHPDYYSPGDTQTNSQSRFGDAFRFIRRNSKEIKDKAIAQITMDHPDFYFPNDAETDDGSRFADAYRLIMQNKDWIVDRGLGNIAVQHPDFYHTGDAATTPSSRFADGYRLILQNKASIINTVWANTLTAYPNHVQYEAKCRRDTGIFIDAIALDVFMGGNRYARKFASSFGNSLSGEETEANYAFNQARDQMQLAASNQLAVQDLTLTSGPADYIAGGANVPNTDPAACADVRNAIATLTTIVTDVISAGNLSGLPAETSYVSELGEVKCRRDLEIFVESLALDLFIKGNEYTYRFAAEYFQNATTPITNGVEGEEAEANAAFAQAKEEMKKAVTNQLFVKDLTIVDKAPGSDYGENDEKRFTPTDASYNPTSGDLVLTIAGHGLTTGDCINIAENGLTFTCGMDGNASQKTYPTSASSNYEKYVQITTITADTITVNIGGAGADQQWTPSNATYDPATGDLVLTIGTHGLAVGEGIVIENDSLTFTCAMDGNSTNKTYPRAGIDEYSGKSATITAVDYTNGTITVNINAAGSNRDFTPTDGTYEPSTGILTLNIGQHGIGVGRSIVLKDNSLTFSCGFGGGGNGSYPRPGTDPYAGKSILITNVGATQHTVTNAAYTAATGALTLTIPTHGFSNGDYVKIADNSLTFTCDKDNNSSTHTYPRTSDAASGRWYAVSNVTANSFDVNVGAAGSFGQFNHTFVSATSNGVDRQDGWITMNVGVGTGSNNEAHTWVSASTDAVEFRPNTTHTFVTASNNAIKHLPQATHTFVRAATDSVIFGANTDNSINTQYNCADVQATIDTLGTIVTDIITAGNLNSLPKEINNGSGGVHESKCFRDIGIFIDAVATDLYTTGNKHTRAFAQQYFSDTTTPILNGFVGEQTQYTTALNAAVTQMRNAVTQSMYDKDLTITADNAPGSPYGQTQQQFTPSTATYDPATGDLVLTMNAHGLSVGNRVNIATGSLTFSCNYQGSVGQQSYPRSSDPVNGAYIEITAADANTITVNVGRAKFTNEVHTFVSASANAVTFAGNTSNQYNDALCSDVQSAIVTLGTIVTDAITNGTLAGMPVENAGTFLTGEAKCRRDMGIFVDAVAQDLWFGGNEFTIAATKEYFDGNTLLGNGVQGEVDPVITAFKRAADLMNRSLNNLYYVKDTTITLDQVGEPAIVSNMHADAHDLIRTNKEFIAREAYERMKVDFPSYTPSAGNTMQDCLDDIYDVLREVTWDVKFGGNSKTYDVAEGFITNEFGGVNYTTVIEDDRRDEIVRVYEYVSSIAIEVLNNLTVSVNGNNPLTQTKDLTIVEDWDLPANLPHCGSVVADVDTLIGILIQSLGTTTGGVGNLSGIVRTAAGYDAVTDHYNHTFVSATSSGITIVSGGSLTATNATYTSQSGDLVITAASHGLSNGDKIIITNNSLTFTCDKDDNFSQHSYPRTTDPVSGKEIEVSGVTTDTFTVNVGAGGVGRVISSTSDPAYDTALPVSAVDATSITLNVGPSPDKSVHTFLSASTGAVVSGGNYPHTFSHAAKGALIAGGAYAHTFVSATTGAVSSGGNYTHTFISAVNNGITANTGTQYTVTGAAYDPASGDISFTSVGHGLSTANTITIADGALTFSCDMDNDVSQHVYPRSTDPASGQSLAITANTADTFTVNVGSSPIVQFNVSSATYNPALGDLVLTIGAHSLAVGTSIKIANNSLTFSCEMDGNTANKTYPRVSDPIADEAVTITAVTGTTITVDVGTTQEVKYDISDATYDAGLGRLTLDIGTHDLMITDGVKIANDSLFFSCGMDNNETVKSYPRSTDPIYNTSLEITNVDKTFHTAGAGTAYDPATGVLTIGMANHGFNATTYDTVTNGSYDAAAGQLVLTIPNHTYRNGDRIRIADNSLTFECSAATGTHTFVSGVADAISSGASNFTAQAGTTYNPVSGDMQITLGTHSLTTANTIQIADGGITFTCDADNHATNHSYPRSTDPVSGTNIAITAVTATTITVNVGIANPTGNAKSYPRAADPVSGRWLSVTNVTANTIEVNVLLGTPSTNSSVHTFVSAVANGIEKANDSIKVFTDSLTFTCLKDGNTVQKTYPRASDPIASRAWLPISNVTQNSFDVFVGKGGPNAQFDHTFVSATSNGIWRQTGKVWVNVGTTTNVEHTPTAADYNPTTGELVLTIGSHSLTVGESVKLGTESLIFTCATDNNATKHAYPRAATITHPSTYAFGNCSDVLATVDTLIGIVGDALKAGTLDTLPSLSSGEWDCANVRGTIETLYDIITDSITAGNISGLPTVNKGDFTLNSESSKCFRDIAFITDAVVNDLRLGGNINSVQAGESYFVGNNLDFIDAEKAETIDAYNYVGSVATAAMRNFDVLVFNCSTDQTAIVDVGDTRGIIIGMSVTEYDETGVSPYVNGALQPGATPIYTNIPEGTYVKRIVDNTKIELGVINSRLITGNTVNTLQTSSTTNLFFAFTKGAWADTLPQTDTSITQDTTTAPGSLQCASTAAAIDTLIGVCTTIINSGVGSVTRQEQTVNTALLASRATVFTIDTTGTGSSNAHDFETGTPVRLVPRPRFDTVTQKYVEVDKRLVRLPNGFSTNQIYYVIAPGRVTVPENYNGTTFFNGSDQTKLMLATSKENAAAGIYIYASETDAIDPDVEIDIYQFVLDDKYDLHTYKCELTNAVNAGIETDISNIFDKPSASTTPHRVFFRGIDGGDLPLVATTYVSGNNSAVADLATGRLNGKTEFYARYQNAKVFTIHETHADAITGANPITFQSGQTLSFNVFANKRRSPFQFEPGFTDNVTTTGKWYVQTKDEHTSSDNIFWRIHQNDYADRPKTTDMWYERLKDVREADERTYKLRYVIPKYLENARDPINGFVIKTRTDDTRKIIPQKILLKPVSGNQFGARFENPRQAGEYIGYTDTDFTSNNLNKDLAYDPYRKDLTGAGIDYRAFIRTTSGIQATIQGARYVADQLDNSINYLELTVYDHAVDIVNYPGLRNDKFTTVKITAPQGGDFITSKTQSITANQIEWTGNSSGLGNIHGYYSVGSDHYLILKNLRGGKLEFSEFTQTRFTQGSVFADMVEDQDFGKSLPLKTLIAKGYPEYYYKQDGANVYTITPGDTVTDSAGVQYYVESVTDAGIIDDTFYIFGYETLQKRIAGQQDGVYYLTCLRGNMSPFPTGAGAGGNFQRFKFSQPVSKLYPLNYRNDPLWFKNSGTTNEEKNLYANLIDPPQAFSAADNYTHGLVTVNDYKNSVTREGVEDLIKQPAFIENTYTGSNKIQAQLGNATSGSEDRLIPIAGNSTVLSDQRYYVELRRPSIARAGNHTFEYLGFGPGNYSTGLPARQEVVLTPEEDFYAQSKKQDGGIVFYTGINSQGDLYIGNRRINAITGEETFIDAATLQDDGDKDDVIGSLVTTFDTPVTFNQNITVVGGEGTLPNTFESPLIVSVQDNDLTQERHAVIVRSNVSSVDPVTQLEQDESLSRTAFTPPTKGDIQISKNRVNAAIFGFNARGNGQEYMFQTHTGGTGSLPSNMTPNNSDLVGNPGGTRLASEQYTMYGNVLPRPGDVLLKGKEVGRTGSLGWIYANYYEPIADTSIFTIEFINSGSLVKLTFKSSNTGLDITNDDLGITSGSQIRINDFYHNAGFNSIPFQVASPNGDAFSGTNNYVHFVAEGITLANETLNWNGDIIANVPGGQPNPTVEFSNSSFKEVGVLGSEALRTETDTIGDYKLGINTIARSAHSAYQKGFVSAETEPRANLDVVGTTFISGKTINSYLTETGTVKTETGSTSAFLVGGDSAAPTDSALFRVNTVDNRIGINVDNASLDSTFYVGGTSKFTDNAIFLQDVEVNGGGGANTADITTTITTGGFNLVNSAGFTGTLNIGQNATTIAIGDTTEADQFINIGRSSLHSNIRLGATPDNRASDGALTISLVDIGGAYDNNESLSATRIKTKVLKIDGDAELGSRRSGAGSIVKLSSTSQKVEFFSGNSATSILDFATNASEIKIAGQGGSTTIRNNLIVDATARFNADVTLCGGFASYSFSAKRAQAGSTAFAHASGVLGNNLFNSNVDLVDVLRVTSNNTLIDTYNQVDTSGSGAWGGATFQQEIPNVGGVPVIEPQTLPALTGNQYYLPIKNKPQDAGGNQYFNENDILLIDTDDSGGTLHPEFVKIVSLPRISTAPYYIVVERLPFGTWTTTRSDHPDTTPIYKCNVQYDATWITSAIDSGGVSEDVYLSQFGGDIDLGDYVIIDREDTTVPADGVDDQGELFKVETLLSQVAKSFYIKNGCDTAQEESVFSVDSTDGTLVTGGDANIGGSLNLTGTCTTPYIDADTNRKLKITNNQTVDIFKVDTCTGNTEVGNQHGTVFMLSEQFGSSPAAYSKDNDVVYVYRHNAQSTISGGPSTTTADNIVTATSNIEIQGNLTAFQKGDLVAIYVSGVGAAIEVIQITDDPYTGGGGELILPTATNAQYPSGGRGLEGTAAQAFSIGANVVKLDKYDRTTTLLHDVPATQGDRATALKARTPNTSDIRLEITLRDADLIAPKLDYITYVRIGTEWFIPDSVDGSNDISFAVKTPKQIRNPNTIGTPLVDLYGGGKLTVHDDVEIYSGNLRMYGSDGQTLVMSIANDDGHSGDGSLADAKTSTSGLTLHGGAQLGGDLKINYENCQAFGLCSDVTTFKVTNREGNVFLGEEYYQAGKVYETETASKTMFHIDNLGSAGVGGTEGAKDFRIYQNNAIDSFGIEKYWTGNGGRRHTYVAFDTATGVGQQIDNPLQVNNNYLVNSSSGSNIVLYLPDNPQTGDMIRFVELSGNLTYNTSLIIRAKKISGIATAIQGDSTGSKLDAGNGQSLATAWDSGELVIQTRNASFGLVFAGTVDIEGSANSRTIPPALRGWWLMEL